MGMQYLYPDFMQTGITVLRYGRLLSFMERPWIPALRRLMAEKGWKQLDLATKSGVRPNTISDILNESDTRVETLAALATALGVPLWALFCGDREYALFTQQVKELDGAEIERARQAEARAVVQAELGPIVEALVAKLTGQSVEIPTSPVRPVLAPAAKGRKQRRA